jgi:hypothetical protein
LQPSEGPSAALNGSFWYYPNASKVPENWYNVNELRQESGDPAAFDEDLFQTLQFFTPSLAVSENDMWVYFDDTIHRISSLLVYLPVWRQVMMSNIECITIINAFGDSSKYKRFTNKIWHL